MPRTIKVRLLQPVPADTTNADEMKQTRTSVTKEFLQSSTPMVPGMFCKFAIVEVNSDKGEYWISKRIAERV